MFDKNKQRTLLPKSHLETLVPGLREFVKPGIIKVYRATPDGKPGEFLRIEYPQEYDNTEDYNRPFGLIYKKRGSKDADKILSMSR